MNLQSLVIVILRLLSLDFCLQVAIRLAPQLLRFTDLSLRSSTASLDFALALPWLMLTGLIGGAIVLWLFAEPIARFVTQGVASDVSLGSLTLADGYSILFIGVGLCYIVSHFSSVLSWAQYFLQSAGSHPETGWSERGVNLYNVLDVFVPFILGIILFFNGRRWAIALARRHTAESPIASPDNNPPPSEGN